MPSVVYVWGCQARKLGDPEDVGAWGGKEWTGHHLLSFPSSPVSPRYYFKKVSDEFDCGVVFEEVREDEAILPVFEEKIIGKVEKVD